MKHFYRFIFVLLIGSFFLSCKTEGSEILGTWYTNGTLGPMKIEIQSSKGKFIGFLVEQQVNGSFIQGGTELKDLIFRDLEYKDGKYLNGLFLQNPKGSNPCDFKMTFYTQDKRSMRAAHQCNTINRLEFFERDGYPEKPYIDSKVNTISLDQLLKANPNNKKK